MKSSSFPVALITGAAKRIGAHIASHLHQRGMNVVVHYRHSAKAAQQLCASLNRERPDSAVAIVADLDNHEHYLMLIKSAVKQWGRLDVLVNNASTFFPTALAKANETEWHGLMNSNLKAPFFLAQAATPYLKKTNGCIVNITDIHGKKPLKDYSIYSIAKAGLIMLTKSLAKELAPEIRVNAVSPGSILWAHEEKNILSATKKQDILQKTLLKRQGAPEDIAKAVWYLIHDANYVTGQVIAVDGGRSLR